MTTDYLEISAQEASLAVIRMNRPKRRNAFDDDMIAQLHAAFTQLGKDNTVRCIAITGMGGVFSAGADLTYMRRMAAYSQEQNITDAERLADMFEAVATSPKPVLALVDGPAIAGGLGLVAAADIAIATRQAFFAISEVRLGLVAATISPYIVAAMGERAARRYMLTGERFTAETAQALGLIHEVIEDTKLDERGRALAGEISKAGPNALAATKDLLRAIRGRPVDATLKRDTAERIAAARVSAEGQEGLSAFLEKRAPHWPSEGDSKP